jgi:hypothetical protein
MHTKFQKSISFDNLLIIETKDINREEDCDDQSPSEKYLCYQITWSLLFKHQKKHSFYIGIDM